MDIDMTDPSAGAPNGESVFGVESSWKQPMLLTAIACLAMILATAVYLTDRDAARALLMPDVGVHVDGKLFGAIGQWLPSFVHPFSFSLLTAAALPVRSAPRYGPCLAWAAVNVAFEVGQHPMVSVRLANALQGELNGMPFGQPLARYFLHGTFDAGDVVAVLLGALAAALVLRLVSRTRKCTHGQ